MRQTRRTPTEIALGKRHPADLLRNNVVKGLLLVRPLS